MGATTLVIAMGFNPWRSIDAQQESLPQKSPTQQTEGTQNNTPATKDLKAQKKSFFENLLENSKMYLGALAGIGFGLNNVAGMGYGAGATFDYIAFERYGLHLGVQTGQAAAKATNLKSGTTTLTIDPSGSLAYVSIHVGAQYGLPKFFNLESYIGLGVALYQLRGENFSFISQPALQIFGSVFYSLLSRLQAGLLLYAEFPSAASIRTPKGDYLLNASESLMQFRLNLVTRYSFF